MAALLRKLIVSEAMNKTCICFLLKQCMWQAFHEDAVWLVSYSVDIHFLYIMYLQSYKSQRGML